MNGAEHEDLREMLREMERVIDHQIRALEEQDDKSEQLIRLVIAALAGGIALGSFLVRGSPKPSVGILVPSGSRLL